MMTLVQLLAVAVGLSMDAFAVSLCRGTVFRQPLYKEMVTCGVLFGGFQALLLALGWMLGARFLPVVQRIDHWVAFVLLLTIGINMIFEAKNKDETAPAPLSFSVMLGLALATSVDALAVGITLACLWVPVSISAAVVGVTCAALCMLGVYVGGRTAQSDQRWPTLLGGIILVFFGVKILIEHIFF